MAFWSRNRVQELHDPVLGTLRFNKPHTWRAQLSSGAPFVGTGPILFVAGSAAGPDPDARDALVAVVERFPDVCDSFIDPLFRLYCEHSAGLEPEDMDPGFPKVSEPSQITGVYSWIGVDVDQGGTSVYQFAFASAWDDTIFEVRVSPEGRVTAEIVGD